MKILDVKVAVGKPLEKVQSYKLGTSRKSPEREIVREMTQDMFPYST